jgi:hypothetical protein
MKHILEKVTAVTVVEGYVLKIRFADGEERVIDLEPALHGELFGPLRDVALFRQAAVDAEVGVITWPNGADIDPSILYQWDAAGDEFCRALQRLPEAESTSA